VTDGETTNHQPVAAGPTQSLRNRAREIGRNRETIRMRIIHLCAGENVFTRDKESHSGCDI